METPANIEITTCANICPRLKIDLHKYQKNLYKEAKQSRFVLSNRNVPHIMDTKSQIRADRAFTIVMKILTLTNQIHCWLKNHLKRDRPPTPVSK